MVAKKTSTRAKSTTRKTKNGNTQETQETLANAPEDSGMGASLELSPETPNLQSQNFNMNSVIETVKQYESQGLEDNPSSRTLTMSHYQNISPEEKYRMISEAAYYEAEKNGFQGDPVENWLKAEQYVENFLRKMQNSSSN